ncbi:hypothetical protein HPB50_010819 [Hyalomma asiaticum]|uniref:Uncharacterized protein n=1 Tax=Hyalomma asiaticum TaxID=266040 RepID=A0ACB7RWQ9_HYAAI|nr:hypothetical protein HPB50_010819 [Hyalomma asiaticum]
MDGKQKSKDNAAVSPPGKVASGVATKEASPAPEVKPKEPGHGSENKHHAHGKHRASGKATTSPSAMSPSNTASPISSGAISPTPGTLPKPSGMGGKGDKHHHKAVPHPKDVALDPKARSHAAKTTTANNKSKTGPGHIHEGKGKDPGKRTTETSPAMSPPANKAAGLPVQPGVTSSPAVAESFSATSAAGAKSLPKGAQAAANPASPPKCGYAGIITAIFVACLLAIIAVSAAFYFRKWKRMHQNAVVVCNTEDCRKHAALLTENLDEKLDPCYDFAAYVCSAARNLTRFRKDVKSVSDGMQFEWYEEFEDTLRSGIGRFPIGRKAVAMYTKCLTYENDAPQTDIFLQYFRNNGLDWPELPPIVFPPLIAIVLLGYTWPVPLWVHVAVQNVSAKSGAPRRRILLKPGAYIPIMLEQHRAAEASFAYTRYWQQFLIQLYPDAASRPALHEDDVDKIREVEKDVLNSLNSVFSSRNPKPVVVTFRELPNLVPNTSTADWVQGFQIPLALEPELNEDDEIAVSHTDLLKVIVELLAKYDDQKLSKHITWLLVQYYAPMASYSLLVAKYADERKAKANLRSFCARHVEGMFRVLTVALSVVSRIAPADRHIIDDGYDGLLAAALDRVTVSNWMDEASKMSVSEKLKAVKREIWPPDAVMKNSTLDSMYSGFIEKAGSLVEFWVNNSDALHQVDKTQAYLETTRLRWNNLPGYASYNYILNAIDLSMSTMAEPAYYREGTPAMLHGGLLFIMANQLVRAMDETGLRWTVGETETDSIVSSHTLKELAKMKRCLTDQGTPSPFPEIPASEIAYNALKKAHEKSGSGNVRLREDLSEDKVYFMTLCYMFCESTGHLNPLAPDCNKVARNSASFAKAFGCPPNSPMNPEKKCPFFNGNSL